MNEMNVSFNMLYASTKRREVNATNTRIKQLRKALDLTQAEFALRIGSTQNAVTGYETGRRNPSSSVVNNICKEFHVREEWLRTGIGEMFQQRSRDDEIAAYVDSILLDESAEFKRRFLAALVHLDEVGWKAMEQFAIELAKGHEAADEPPEHVPPGYSSRAELEAEADEFAAMAREQFLSEKIPGYQAFSVKESDDPDGAA